jgi:hypothetical protein
LPVEANVANRPGCGTIAMSGGLPDLACTTTCCSKFLSAVFLTVTPVQVVKSLNDLPIATPSLPTTPEYTLTVLPEMPGQSFLMVSQYVASSLATAAAPPELPADEAGADPAADAGADAPADAGADAAADAGAEPAAAGADEAAAAVLLGVELLLLLQDAMIRARALIPAMVAIALLADVRDTRPTSVSGGKVRVRVLTTRAMKAFATQLCKPRPVIRS